MIIGSKKGFMAKNLQKRKTFLIDRSFQYRFIGVFLLSTILALVIFTGAVVLYYWASSMAGDNLFKEFIDINKQVYELQEDGGGGQIRVPTTETIYGVKRWEIVLPPILINNLFILIIISAIGIIYSHRIAGPAYRISRVIGRVLHGESGVRVTLRKKDSLKELSERINDLLIAFDQMRKVIDVEE